MSHFKVTGLNGPLLGASPILKGFGSYFTGTTVLRWNLTWTVQSSDKHAAEQGEFFTTEVIPHLKGCGSKITPSMKNLHRTTKFTEEALNLLSHRIMTYLITASILAFLESSSVDYHDGII